MAVVQPREREFHGRGLNLAIIAVVFVVVAVCLVMSRLAARVSLGRRLGPDDYVIVLSVVSHSVRPVRAFGVTRLRQLRALAFFHWIDGE